MNDQVTNVFYLVAGIAMLIAGIWCLCVKLPAERERQKKMLRASGVIQGGLPASNVFKQASDVMQDATIAAVPMIAFRTADGGEVLTTVGALHSGRGSRRAVFAIGQSVGLRYDPADPTVVMLDGQPTWMRFIGMACAFLLITGPLLTHACVRDMM